MTNDINFNINNDVQLKIFKSYLYDSMTNGECFNISNVVRRLNLDIVNITK